MTEVELEQASTELRSAGLLPEETETMVSESSSQPLDRRDALLRVGMGLAAALPLVISIGVPTAAEAATCFAAGTACTSSSQCCSGLCVSLSCV